MPVTIRFNTTTTLEERIEIPEIIRPIPPHGDIELNRTVFYTEGREGELCIADNIYKILYYYGSQKRYINKDRLALTYNVNRNGYLETGLFNGNAMEIARDNRKKGIMETSFEGRPRMEDGGVIAKVKTYPRLCIVIRVNHSNDFDNRIGKAKIEWEYTTAHDPLDPNSYNLYINNCNSEGQFYENIELFTDILHAAYAQRNNRRGKNV
ncbi:MAG: hypothetical protein LBO69_00055 [Ignavibacteria bacterium]|jgi:hypothetical protein|nr:hypothetical protein [Ignavibacteria bacterium]